MAVTETEVRPARAARAARPGRATRRGVAADSHDGELDLLTAALIGLTVGVGITMLIHNRQPIRRSVVRGAELAGHGARLASLAGVAGAEFAGKAARGARAGYDRSKEWAGDLSVDGIGGQMQEYFEAAKDAIEDTVSGELQDLRKSIHRRRRRLGI